MKAELNRIRWLHINEIEFEIYENRVKSDQIQIIDVNLQPKKKKEEAESRWKNWKKTKLTAEIEKSQDRTS